MKLRWGLAVLLAVLAGCRSSAALSPPFEDTQCRVAPNLLADDSLLPLTATAIGNGERLTIVALGSSSTAGVGASRKSAAYPAVLERELMHRLGPRVHVINRGVGGETIDRTAARIARDVLPLHPTLVVWQVGTNDLLRGLPLGRFQQILAAGIMTMRRHGIDVMLMSPQYVPAGEMLSEMRDYLRAIDHVADLYDVPVLHRHQIMAYWATSGELSVRQMLARDQFHMSDEGYHCLGEVAADFVLRHCAGGKQRKTPAQPRNV